MQIVDARGMTVPEMAALLKKDAFDEIVLSPRVQDGVDAMWGEHLTAAQVVDRIVRSVRHGGNEKLLYFTKMIDQVELTPETMKVSAAEFNEARTLVDPAIVDSIKRAIRNIRRFHEEQLPRSWFSERPHGSLLGQKITPIDSVGIYVPGGTASYPSSVIMNAVPAKVAGVRRIVMAVPPGPNGKMNPYVLVAAEQAGVDEIYKMGGAQAIAALAFGTETIRRVNKITGAGNIFVTLAKKEVFGHVDIDMLAGPSEILILADKKANPVYLAADMLSQAEHDPLASAILLTDSEKIARKVVDELEKQIRELPREEIAADSLDAFGKIIIAPDMDTAIDMANLSAPGHLAVMTENPFQLMPRLHNCGAIFLGEDSPEPVGDYFAGPNHILPTGGTAKFYSVLNVETFMKKSSIIAYSRQSLLEAAQDIINMAEAERLDAHANAIRKRLERRD